MYCRVVEFIASVNDHLKKLLKTSWDWKLFVYRYKTTCVSAHPLRLMLKEMYCAPHVREFFAPYDYLTIGQICVIKCWLSYYGMYNQLLDRTMHVFIWAVESFRIMYIIHFFRYFDIFKVLEKHIEYSSIFLTSADEFFNILHYFDFCIYTIKKW